MFSDVAPARECACLRTAQGFSTSGHQPMAGAGNRVRCGGRHRNSEARTMGTFKWPLRISSMEGHQVQDIEAIVGTGAVYTMLPGSLLRDLGIEPRGRRRVPLADGRHVDLDYGQAWVTIGGESEITLVVFGEDNAPALLGTSHTYRSGPGGGSHRTATGSHTSHHVLGPGPSGVRRASGPVLFLQSRRPCSLGLRRLPLQVGSDSDPRKDAMPPPYCPPLFGGV